MNRTLSRRALLRGLGVATVVTTPGFALGASALLRGHRGDPIAVTVCAM